MKRLRNFVTAIAVVAGVVTAFARPMVFVQQGWYDSNGATAGGGVLGNITYPPGDNPACLVQASGINCSITVAAGTFAAYATKAAAESNNAAFRLKHN